MPHRELLVRAFGSIDFQSEMTKNRLVAASGAVILVVLTGKKSDVKYEKELLPHPSPVA
jgi:hypothetical protein